MLFIHGNEIERERGTFGTVSNFQGTSAVSGRSAGMSLDRVPRDASSLDPPSALMSSDVISYQLSGVFIPRVEGC